jgi:hypothetical protein
MDKPSVYIETSIVSYLAADPSRHPVTLRNQQLTHAWWNTQRERYALYTSNLTRDEAGQGDPKMAQRRLALLNAALLLPRQAESRDLANALYDFIPLPPRAGADAVHIATAAVHGVAYLLTWNCKHIANPRLYPRMSKLCSAAGFQVPLLVTPAELMGVR